MAKPLTVLGLQRTGTNFIEQCARSNWNHVQIRNTKSRGNVWKHDYKVDESVIMQPEKSFIWLTKHPYLWVESVMRSPVDTWKRWPQLKSNQNTIKEALVKCKQYSYDIREMGKLWSDHTEYWLRMMDKRLIIHVQYEKLIESDEKTQTLIKSWGKTLGYEVKSDKISVPKKVSQSEKFDENKRKKYLEMKLDHLDWKKISLLNESLNKSVVERVGYKLFLTEEDFDKKNSVKWSVAGNVPKEEKMRVVKTDTIAKKTYYEPLPEPSRHMEPEEAARRISGRG